MKKAVLFVFTLLSFATFAQNKANLTISTTGSTNLKIKLGVYRYSFQDRTATFQELAPGSYDLTIYQWQKKQDGKFDYVQVYNSSILLAANRHTEISILRFGKVAWDEGPVMADSWSDNYSNPWPVQGNGQHSGYKPEMDAIQFAQVKKTINSEFGDANMLSVAKAAVKGNFFTTAQIKEIAKLFSSDETKLDFTKYAYDYVTDKGSYITIGDIFYSSLVQKELINYINNR